MGIMPTATLKNGQTLAYWTRDAVLMRIRAAMATLRDMPLSGCFPAGIKSTMPEVRQRHEDWYPELGSKTFTQEWQHMQERLAEERHHFRRRPTAAEITAMEEALAWQHMVDHPRYWVCLTAWAGGARSGPVARRFSVTTQTVRDWRRRALDQIVLALNQED